jgi:hypothetical protein
MTVRLYRSTDAGAPQLGALGAVNSILKACLVTGFGSRTPAGWSIAFEDSANHKIALKQGGENGRFFKCDHSEDIRFARVNGYLTMSDIDTGIEGMFDTQTYDGTPGGFFPALYTTSSAQFQYHDWIVIADERSFYYIVTAFATSYCWAGFCGDIALTNPDNPYNFSMIAYLNKSDTTSTTTNQHYTIGLDSVSFTSPSTATKRMVRALSQMVGMSHICYTGRHGGIGGNPSGYIGSEASFTYPDINLGGLLVKPIEIADSATAGYAGILPILREPLNFYYNNSSSNRAYSITDKHLITVGNKKFYLIPIQQNNAAFMFEVDSFDG